MPPAERNAHPTTVEDRYRVLLDIGHTITRTLRPEELYRTIYRETARVLEAGGFYISLYDPEKDLATVVFYADQGEERSVQITYRGSDSEVLRTGKGAMIADRVERQSLLVIGDDSTDITRSAISAPLIYEGEVIGAISTQSYSPSAYRLEDLELLQGIADIAAVAVTNAQHVAELETRRREAERIEEIGRAVTSSLDAREVLRKVIDAVLELLHADGSSVWLMEGDTVRVAASGGKLRMPEGSTWTFSPALFRAIVEEGRSLVLDDIRRSELIPEALAARIRAGSGVVVPLVMNEEVAGALSAGRVETHAFSEDDVSVLQRLASQTAVALVNAHLLEDIQALSLTDPLTDLPNRRHLDMHMEREIAAARRGRRVSLVLFDFDDFKRLNDREGHVVGDTVLRCFGKILRGESRAMNLVARYGGDEFVSVLSEISRDGAELHCRRILERVAADPLLSRYGVTVSHGIAEFDPDSMFEVEDLIRAADEDLYRSKGIRGSSGASGEEG